MIQLLQNESGKICKRPVIIAESDHIIPSQVPIINFTSHEQECRVKRRRQFLKTGRTDLGIQIIILAYDNECCGAPNQPKEHC